MGKATTLRIYEAFKAEIAFDGGERIAARQTDRKAAYRLASVRAQNQAFSYLRSLMSGTVMESLEAEFKQAVRDQLSYAKEYRLNSGA